MSPSDLAVLVYEQAQRALDQQERQVNALRQQMGTLLAAAALTASFFGTAAIERGETTLPAMLAGIALALTVASGAYVLYPHRFEFAADARQLHTRLAADRDDPDRMFRRAAFGLRDAAVRNDEIVERLARCVAVSGIVLLAQLACWTWAFAIL